MKAPCFIIPLLLAWIASVGIVGASSEAEKHFREGFQAVMAGEWVQAISYYTDSIKLDPKNAAVYFQRAVVLEITGKHKEAIADYERAIVLKPDYYLAIECLAKLYAESGDYARALEFYDRALSMVEWPKWRSVVKSWISGTREKMQAAGCNVASPVPKDAIRNNRH